jgi:hypothetical protein
MMVCVRAADVVAYVNNNWFLSTERLGGIPAVTVNVTFTVRTDGLASGTVMVTVPL